MVTVPHQYTAPLPYPPALGKDITVGDLVEQLFDAYDVIDRCNADRNSVRALSPSGESR